MDTGSVEYIALRGEGEKEEGETKGRGGGNWKRGKRVGSGRGMEGERGVKRREGGVAGTLLKRE